MPRPVLIILSICVVAGTAYRSSASVTPVPPSTPAAVESARTSGGMEVRFPAEHFVAIDQGTPNALTITSLDPNAPFQSLFIADAWDTWETHTTPTLDTAVTLLLDTLHLIGEPSNELQRVTLPNGSLMLIPYALHSGGAVLYALLELVGGRIVIAEIIIDDERQLSTLMQNPQPWLSILSSIHFVASSASLPLPEIALVGGPLRLDQMPVGTIIFASNVMLPLTDVWTVASSERSGDFAIINDAVTLAYNRAEALATFRLDSLGGTSFIDWRTSVMNIMGDALTLEGSPPTGTAYTRSDGTTLEHYVSQDLALSLFFVDLGGDQAAYVLVTMIEAEKTRRQQIIDSLRALLTGMTRFERIPPG